MSCNGCRVLRKRCSETCILRPCLERIDTPEAQGHATLFLAKFFGRAALISFLSNVPPNQRPALFQSLLYEASGRTVNPVGGAIWLLWTGNWQVCQSAVESVLRGGTLKPNPVFLAGAPSSPTNTPPRFTNRKHRKQKELNHAPSMTSGETVTTVCFESGGFGGADNHRYHQPQPQPQPQLLNLFV